jgi:IS5 family transposase
LKRQNYNVFKVRKKEKMRQIHQKQLPIIEPCGNHKVSRLLDKISIIIDEHPVIAEQAFEDLLKDDVCCSAGRESLSADQVVRVAILYRLFNCSYRELEFRLSDSVAARRFARLAFDNQPRKSSLQQDIKSLKAETWEIINKILVGYAVANKVESGKKIRTDTTVIESNIHHPTDSRLLTDCVRSVSRLLEQVSTALPVLHLEFIVNLRRAKKRNMEIANPSGKKGIKRKREKSYKDLIKITKNTYGYGHDALITLQKFKGTQEEKTIAKLFMIKLESLLPLVNTIIDQAYRRVVLGETVPVKDKIVSIFEGHTNIIVKDRRDTLFGHKFCLTTGTSSLIIDAVIEKGNPSDSTLVKGTIDRVIDVLGLIPNAYALDGGFTSRNNVNIVKDAGVKEVCFHKKKGIDVMDMVSSPAIFKKLKKFRAGIEGVISALKRELGLSRATWKGLDGFKKYVWSGIVTFNLSIIGKHLLKQ